MTTAPSKSPDTASLDKLTHGAFTAATSSERAARIRDWLATEPTPEHMQDVFKEMQSRDKGAAKPLREKLDELKRAKGQQALALEWAERAGALLALPRLNIADALAWQRDAAKAGAPLSREPLSQLKQQLNERVKAIEDLQHRVQVQREAAVLMAQRIEVLSTKPWRDAQSVLEVLRADVAHWQEQAAALVADAGWVSVDPKFPALLDGSRTQLLVVWDAFCNALSQAVAAAQDPAASLPSVPVWADELRAARGVTVEAAPKAPKTQIDPEIRAKSTQAVRDALLKLEQEVGLGHGKASASAAAAMRATLKEHGRLIDDALENQAHAALAAAGELEGWQRWRADQLREELVAKAEGLLNRPEGQALGGRKVQESLRALREQWKQTDQGGVPNHGLWKRFDDACNEAHKVVEAWLDKVKAESAEHRAQRLALIDELKAWTQRNVERVEPHEWKAFNRALHQFADRWRDAGHIGEKMFAELQPLWKEALHAAAAPLESAQKQSIQVRQAMVDDAVALGAAPALNIDAVRTLQQRWQAEAQTVPLERRLEQRLWDSFRKPIDDAFNRKTLEREKAAAALSDRDRTVLDAAKALEAANASADAQKIRAAVAGLEAALRGQALAVAAVAAGKDSEEKQASAQAQSAVIATEIIANTEPTDAAQLTSVAPSSTALGAAEDGSGATVAEPVTPPEAPPVVKAARAVVAVRGDDRPGMKKAEPVATGRGGKFGDRKDAGRGGFGADRGGRGDSPRTGAPAGERGGWDRDRAPRFGERPLEDRGPRLGDAAFRAQREALEHADFALKKLAAQAHGEVLTHVMAAWEKRDPSLLPSQQELGRAVAPQVRAAWLQALGKPASGDAAEILLRLEMAAELPTPAEHLTARRSLQLQLLTRRNEPAPAQTWGQDAAKLLSCGFSGDSARRAQNVLKALLRRQ